MLESEKTNVLKALLGEEVQAMQVAGRCRTYPYPEHALPFDLRR